MNDFAELLDRLAFEPRRNAKLRLMEDFFRTTPDPERGYALAALTGGLSFRNAKPGLVRALIAERTDPVLFALSYDYVGDLSETVALMWPAPSQAGTGHNASPPRLADVVEGLSMTAKTELPGLLARWLDALDETGRWALLKLITGALRIGVSARLAKTAVAGLGGVDPNAVEELWHGLTPPYEPLFAWLEGRAERPEGLVVAPFRPPMLSHPLDEEEFSRLDPAEFCAEWKWDGIRIEAVRELTLEGRRIVRLYSRTGEDITGSFPDLCEALIAEDAFVGALDGELLVLRGGRVESFNVLQQRLNRKAITPRLMQEFPAHIRAYDLLGEGEEDLRPLPFAERRRRLEALVARLAGGRVDLSPLVPFASWEELVAARARPEEAGAGIDAEAVEGVMLKRRDSPYVPGRPKGLWYKWKHDPHLVDAVLMYAQRGHGKRSSYYSDYTFGLWRSGPEGEELVPVGKAYFGFTDEELKELDRFVRRETVNRFGPVREVVHTGERGLVLEVAFEGVQQSTRHKSGVAMRFPRISRIRWDKPPREADRLDYLAGLLPREGTMKTRAGKT
ncbi:MULTISPECIES: cisplatin damage response ATP-dependent DNA ligase [unclassified Chelatococcus]|uniref:cisplatin damage response ATP-dependent DNA ligase n=1 Tax=unclassified Chelatococcus TaxID=2638111 RepID=UPI000306E717|nr:MULTISPECIES: cisplatin damage response ATP-dependent DNA ligase [unclassified Chelatococcus]ALA17010.1 ATP-dependent DNA ligase [Chelatococcus sp. CO-6]